MNHQDVAIVLQGPTTYVDQAIQCYGTHPHVVWSTWVDEPADNLEKIRQSPVELIATTKPTVKGFANSLFQAHSSFIGIRHFMDNPEIKIVIKIRGDLVMSNLPVFLDNVKIGLQQGPLAFLGCSKSHLNTWYLWDFVVAGRKKDMLRFWEPEYSPEFGKPYPEEYLQQRYFRWLDRGLINDSGIPEAVPLIDVDLAHNMIRLLKYDLIANDPLQISDWMGRTEVNGFPQPRPNGRPTLRIERLTAMDYQRVHQTTLSITEDWCLWLHENESITAEQVEAIITHLETADSPIHRIPMFYEEVPGHLTCRLEPRLLRRGMSILRVWHWPIQVVSVPLSGALPLLVPPWVSLAHQMCTEGELAHLFHQLQETFHAKGVDTPVVTKWMATSLLEQGELDQALRLLKTATDSYPLQSDLHYLLGQAYRLKGDRPNAEQALEKARATAARNPYFEFYYNIEDLCNDVLAS